MNNLHRALLSICFFITAFELMLFRQRNLEALTTYNSFFLPKTFFTFVALLFVLAGALWLSQRLVYILAGIWFLLAQWFLFPALLGYEVFAAQFMVWLILRSTPKFYQLGAFLLLIQLSAMYFFSALGKIIGPMWSNINFTADRLSHFASPNFQQFLIESPQLVTSSLAVTPYLQILLSFTLVLQPTRNLSALLLIGFHALTIVFLDLTGFALFAICCLVLFYNPALPLIPKLLKTKMRTS